MGKLCRSTFLFLGCSLLLAADVNKGVELYNQGEYAKAEAELSKDVQANGNDARAQRYLGLAQVEQGKAGDAAAHIAKADELEPSGETKLALARLYVEQKDWDKAEAALKEASGDDLDYVQGLLNFNRQRYKEAADSFESALQKDPNKAYAHYYAGLAYNGLKRQDKMLSHFEMFLRMRPNAPEARKVRAVLRTGQ